METHRLTLTVAAEPTDMLLAQVRIVNVLLEMRLCIESERLDLFGFHALPEED